MTAATPEHTSLQLARQLRQPQGPQGLQVAETMHRSNIGMTRACFAALPALPDTRLLEIGHGNAAHLPELMGARTGLRYQGLELSALMREEAARLHASECARGTARFAGYDGGVFPFDAASFDQAMSVNTVYFLPDVLAFLREVRRVLRPGGALALAFAPRRFMQQLAFAQHGFALYEAEDLMPLLRRAGFLPDVPLSHREQVPSKERPGTLVERAFLVLRAQAV